MTALILGDSSAWIDHLRNRRTKATTRLRHVLGTPELVTTDVVVMEVLAGARGEPERRRLERGLRTHRCVPTESSDFAAAAAIYRACRRQGATPRSLLDCLTAAVAIRVDAAVLHSDRDFAVIARHVDLRIDG